MSQDVQQDAASVTITAELLDKWVADSESAVALNLKQKLLPVGGVEGKEAIVFPPTYADIGYNIDTLSDGRKVATIDSVGSQANRMEPLFKTGGPFADLVPQLNIKINGGMSVSLLDLAHRAADATVMASDLAPAASSAFVELRNGNAGPLCALAPTSLVFGVWDSRGVTGEKRPRLVRSVIRAWDVEVLHAAAQFNSVWKRLDDAQREELEGEAKRKRADLAEKGLKDAPATFRKTKVQQYRDGSPNPEARVLGGVLMRGRIEREITVNLIALRGLRGQDEKETKLIRQYLLGLTLLAATAELDLFLREGCLLRWPGDGDEWYAIPRRGSPERIDLSNAVQLLRKYTVGGLEHLKRQWPRKLEYTFDTKRVKELLAKKGEDESVEG